MGRQYLSAMTSNIDSTNEWVWGNLFDNSQQLSGEVSSTEIKFKTCVITLR